MPQWMEVALRAETLSGMNGSNVYSIEGNLIEETESALKW